MATYMYMCAHTYIAINNVVYTCCNWHCVLRWLRTWSVGIGCYFYVQVCVGYVYASVFAYVSVCVCEHTDV